MTQFATRMLGDIVEFDFEVEPTQSVQIGQVVGWIEGFKAVSDLYSVVEGNFVGSNQEAAKNSELICRDPYHKGWLYEIDGMPDPESLDVDGYVGFLDETIDRMLERPWQGSPQGKPE